MGLRIYQGKSFPVLLFVPCSEINVCSKSYIYATLHICIGSASWQSRRASAFGVDWMNYWGLFMQSTVSARDLLCNASELLIEFSKCTGGWWVGGEEVVKGICFVRGWGGWNHCSDRPDLDSDRRLEISCEGSHRIDWNCFLNGIVFVVFSILCYLLNQIK